MTDVFIANKKPASEPPVHHPKQSTTNHPKVTHHKKLKPSEKFMLEGHSRSALAAYCYFPDHVKFIGADSEERIVLLLRKHPITNLWWIFISIIMVSAPIISWAFGFFDAIPVDLFLVGIIFWYLITFAFVFEEFLSWFFNVYIVTDERIFDVDFINLVYREMTDANLDQIQDVTVRVGSVIRTVFDYGDVIIQTAAQIPQIDFEAVPYPDKVAQVLRELRVEEEIERIEGRVR